MIHVACGSETVLPLSARWTVSEVAARRYGIYSIALTHGFDGFNRRRCEVGGMLRFYFVRGARINS